jgi:protoporphyrinogen/coproporphyrinogen III oxidase
MKRDIASDITIIGAGLTGLTAAFYLKRAGKSVTVVERSHRVGGVIRTFSHNGFTYEAGPNTGVLSSAELVQLFDDQGSSCALEVANPSAKRRLIWKDGTWYALPSSLGSAVGTPLFAFADKLRILGEPFRKPGTTPYETLDQLVLRRLGRSFLDYAIDPFISGIYAGDPSLLVPKFALPKLYNLEQNYGSFIRGAIKKGKEPKTPLEKRATKEVFSVDGGLQALVDALATAIGSENIILNAENTQVTPLDGRYQISTTTTEGEAVSISSAKVVTTAGAYELPALLPFLTADELAPITHLRYAKVAQVVAGFREWNGIPLNGFGGLIPSKEKRQVLGILFPSSIFANRAPEGGALLSIFAGGIKNEAVFNLSDDELKAVAMREISETMRTNSRPDLLEVFRYPHAIAQYERSSEERFAAIEKIQTACPGLILAGSIRDGIGMADRVKQGVAIAQGQ